MTKKIEDMTFEELMNELSITNAALRDAIAKHTNDMTQENYDDIGVIIKRNKELTDALDTKI